MPKITEIGQCLTVLLKNKSGTFLLIAVLRVILFLHSSIASGNSKEYLTSAFKHLHSSRKEFLSEHFAENHDFMTYGCKIMMS